MLTAINADTVHTNTTGQRPPKTDGQSEMQTER